MEFKRHLIQVKEARERADTIEDFAAFCGVSV